MRATKRLQAVFASIILVVSGLAVLSGPAQATEPAVTSSGWAGTITVSRSYVFAQSRNLSPVYDSESTTVTYTNLHRGVSSNAPMDAWEPMHADVDLTGQVRWWGEGLCAFTASYSYSGPSDESRNDAIEQFGYGSPPDGDAMLVWEDSGGSTYVVPRGFGMAAYPVYDKPDCQSSNPQRTGATVSEYDGRSRSAGVPWPASTNLRPLVDDDPNPEHLKGTTAFTLENFPYLDGPGIDSENYGYDSYQYTLTYDLTRTLTGTVQHDQDNDGVIDSLDNCPTISNAKQADADGDLIGDACEVEAAFATRTYLNSTQVDLVAADSGDGASYMWEFGDGKSGNTREVVREYHQAGEYQVTLTVSRGNAHDSVTHTVAADPAKTYAPTVVMHPKESRYPYDPSKFVAKSILRWSHDRSCPDHAIDSSVSASKLGSGAYTHKRAGEVTCGHTGKSYTTKQLTAPRNKRSVLPSGEKLEGFFLDLRNANYNGTKAMDTVPMYVEFKSNKYIVYWIFYAFNDWKGTATVAGVDERHEGDWEHIVVQLSDTNNAKGVAYYQHYCQPKVLSWAQMKTGFGAGTGLDADTHPLVFSAHGGHASYWKPGTFKAADGQTKCGRTQMVKDTVASSNKRWTPWDDAGLKNTRTAGWYGFGGLWGSPGVIKVLNHNGILGPSTYKFNDPIVSDVPAAWQ